MAKKKNKEPVKVQVLDPEKADRKLLLSDRTLELKAGVEKLEVELLPAQLKELKEKYPYLLVE